MVGFGAIYGRKDRRLHLFYRPDKAITPPGKSLDIGWFLHRITERLTYACDCVVHAVVEVNKGVGLPKPVPKFFAGYEVAGRLQKNRKDLNRLPL